MANSPQAIKRARQAEKRRAGNVSLRSRLRTSIKKVFAAIESGDKEVASEKYRLATKLIDGSVNKNLLHKNKAARVKSRLNTRVKAL